MKFKILIGLPFIFFTINTMHAQVVLPKVLETPIQKAIENNRELAQRKVSIEQTKLQKQSALSHYIPTIEATGGYGYFSNDLIIDIPTVTLPQTGTQLFEDKTKLHNSGQILHGGVMAKTVLFSGMQVETGAKALKQKTQADEWLLKSKEDSIVIEVINSFDLLHYLQASEILIKDSDHRLEVEELRVEQALKNGLAIPFDRDKIKLARLKLASARTELEGSKRLVTDKITYLTGMDPQEILAIEYQLQPLMLTSDSDISNKPELKALKMYQEATQSLERKAKLSFLPQIVAFGGVNYSGLFDWRANTNPNYLQGIVPQLDMKVNQLALSPNWMVGIGLKWEIFSMEKIHQIKKAKLVNEQLNYKYEDSQEKLKLLYEKSKVEYQVKVKQVDFALQQKVIAQNSLTSSESQYKNGMMSIIERLEAENDYLKANQEEVKSLIEERKSALEALHVIGNLQQKIIFQ